MIWLLTVALLIVSGAALCELHQLNRDYERLDEKYISLLRLCRQKDEEFSSLKRSYLVLNGLLKEWEDEYSKASLLVLDDDVVRLRTKYALDAIEIQGELGSAWDALAEVEACLRGDRDTELGITA